jgi:hypothetical protein
MEHVMNWNQHIRGPGTQDDDPRRISPGISEKKHSDKNCNCTGVKNMFEIHDGLKSSGIIRFQGLYAYRLITLKTDAREGI